MPPASASGPRPAQPEELSLRRALGLYRRALLLRCPHCGARGLLASWFHLQPRCHGCGLRTERGEEDFFLGSMMWNIVFSEGLLLVFLVGLVLLRWPAVPWAFLQYGGVALMVAAPFAVFPWTKTTWLASDILIRPVTEAELQWHRSSDLDTLRPQHAR